MTEPLDAQRTALAKLAGLRANVRATLSADIPKTGWSLRSTLDTLAHYSTVLDELRTAGPALFGDLPSRDWAVSIASQRDALLVAERELRDIFTRASRAGLCPPEEANSVQLPATSQAAAPGAPRSGFGTGIPSWMKEHLWQVLVGLFVAYLVYRFGWNQ